MALYCPNCGKELPDYAEFCDNCGTRIPDIGKRTSSPKPAEEQRISPVTEPRKNTSRKGSFTGTLVKLAVCALILFGLFNGGMWLWNKWHYNPALDGNVYPGNNGQSSSALTPAADEMDYQSAGISDDHT